MNTSAKTISHEKLRELVLTAILSALIIVMTVVPYTGYITVGVVEITTLHIVVALGACFLGWKDRGVIIVPGLHDQDEILKTDGLQKAEIFGKSIL